MRAAVLLVFVMLQGGGWSEQLIHSNFEGKLQPYFPNATVVFQPQQHVLFGLTCVEGAGPQLAQLAGDSLTQELGQNSPSGIGVRLFLAAKGYRYVAIGFDTWVTFFDLQTKSASFKQTGADPAYSQFYQRECIASRVAHVPADGICDNCK